MTCRLAGGRIQFWERFSSGLLFAFWFRRGCGRSRRRSKRRSFGNLLFEPLLARFCVLIVGIHLQNLFVVGHRILKIVFYLVNIRAIIDVLNLVRLQFDKLGVVGQSLIVILYLHFDRCTLLMNARRLVRSEFKGFVVVGNGVPISLVVCSRISALLVNCRKLVRVFVVHGGGFLKEVNGFVEVLVFSGLGALTCQFVRFGILFFRCLAYL